MSTALQPVHGNHACALAAVAAGCRFFAGYPITPSSEIAERMSRELPRVGGTFIQMEDEIASMGAIIGASMGGAKVMTATSGPGFSLKQENLGYAAMTEVPCVVVDVMRGGPSTGMPTRPAQSDIMQARWGTHGDHPIIAITPASVQEVYDETIRAFNLSEKFRVPVVILYDQVIGHLLESIELHQPGDGELTGRKPASGDPKDFLPYRKTEDGIPEMVRPGEGYRVHTTGLLHAENGFPTQDPEIVTSMMDRILSKVDRYRDEIESFEAIDCDDAEVVIVSYGISARAAKRAVTELRGSGVKVGLFRPITIWPFPERAFAEASANAKAILVPEMNDGQLSVEIERLVSDRSIVHGLNKIDGEPISPTEVATRVKELLA